MKGVGTAQGSHYEAGEVTAVVHPSHGLGWHSASGQA